RRISRPDGFAVAVRSGRVRHRVARRSDRMSEDTQRRHGGRRQHDQEHTAFPLATHRELGYQPDQVDTFLERARASYEGGAAAGSRMTAAEVRSAAFSVKKHGYSARYVDAALDRLEEVFYERERRAEIRARGEEAWWNETRELLSEVRGRM